MTSDTNREPSTAGVTTGVPAGVTDQASAGSAPRTETRQGTPGRSTKTRPKAPGSARERLSGRVLVVAGSLERHKYPALIQAEAISLESTGLVICGAEWAAAVRHIRASHPDLFVLCDPVESERLFASAEDPFPQEGGQAEGLFPFATLEERLQAQIEAGASLAMTPTGYIQAGDRLALRAVITQANTVKRDDVVVLLPLDFKWLVGAALKLVMAAVKRCKHPVAITLGDSNGDPMSHRGVLDGAHELAALEDPPMFHKTDLAGLDMMAHGALATSVGVIASKRRASIPGKAPFAPRTKKGATVLMPTLLRFRRTLDMQDQWFASRQAHDCRCVVCNDQPIDRFGSHEYDCVFAAQHNAVGIIGYVNEAGHGGGFPAYWPDKVRDAIVAHVTLGQYVGTPVNPPRELEAWSKALPGSLEL